MTIHFGDFATEIDKTDTFKLRCMAEAVLQDRPTFRRIQARTGEHPVEIYTERASLSSPILRSQNSLEFLIVKSADKHIRLSAQDCDALQQVIRQAN